jgi:hypothetical protein
MQKHYVVAGIGTLILLANFLVPGLAFGDESQSEQLTIECAHAGDLAWAETPDDVTFNPVESSGTTAQSTVDSAIIDSTELPASSAISVQDTRSGGNDFCPIEKPGFTLQAQGTALQGPDSHIIAADSIRLKTSPNINGNIYLADTKANFSNPSGEGNRYWENGTFINTIAPYTFYSYFTIPAVYQNNSCHLSTACTILQRTAPTNSVVTIGTALAIYEGILPNQYPGAYTGTITYTLNPS